MGDIVQILIIICIIIFAGVKKLIGNDKKEKKERPGMPIPQAYDPMEEEEDYDPPPPLESAQYPTQQNQTQKTGMPPLIQQEPDGSGEFNIESAEEVRRGIIWSEILNRKY